MTANELRIGNIVLTTRDFLARATTWSDTLISHEDIYGIACGNDHHYKPIPLTEEWLLKLGFKYDADNDKLFLFLPIHEFCTDRLSFRKSEGHICLEVQVFRTLFEHTKYVHQLQNLYFTLTGKELTIGGNNE